jgi:hypothetical protein
MRKPRFGGPSKSESSDVSKTNIEDHGFISYGPATKLIDEPKDSWRIDFGGWAYPPMCDARVRESGRLGQMVRTLLLPDRFRALRRIADLIPSPTLRRQAEEMLDTQEAHCSTLKEQRRMRAVAWIHFATWALFAWMLFSGPFSGLARAFRARS